MYLEYGTKNGLYFPPAELAELEHQAESIRRQLKLGPYVGAAAEQCDPAQKPDKLRCGAKAGRQLPRPVA